MSYKPFASINLVQYHKQSNFAAFVALQEALQKLELPDVEGVAVKAFTKDSITIDENGVVSHVAGAGGVTDHLLLTNIGLITHAELDVDHATLASHLTNHPAGVTDHTLLSNIGVTSHPDIDAALQTLIDHLANHPSGVTDHTLLSNIGVTSHADIDAALQTLIDHLANHPSGSAPIIAPGPITFVNAGAIVYWGCPVIGHDDSLTYPHYFAIGDPSDQIFSGSTADIELTISFYDHPGGSGNIKSSYMYSDEGGSGDIYLPDIPLTATSTMREATISGLFGFNKYYEPIPGSFADLKIACDVAGPLYINAIRLKRLDHQTVFEWRAGA